MPRSSRRQIASVPTWRARRSPHHRCRMLLDQGRGCLSQRARRARARPARRRRGPKASRRLHRSAQTLLTIGGAGAPAPILTGDIPIDRRRKPMGEVVTRPPAELALNLAGIDRVTRVVPRPVRHEGHKPRMRRACREACVEQPANSVNHVEVSRFGARPDQIRLADAASCNDPPQCRHMVVDMQPVADVRALAVDRQRLASYCIEHHQGNELLRKLIGAVIIGAVRHQDWQPVGAMPGASEMVGAGLARRVGRVRSIRADLAKLSCGRQLAIDLVGGNVKETKLGAARGIKAAPVVKRNFEQRRRTDDVGPDESKGRIDRTIDMAFSGKMVHRSRTVLIEDSRDCSAVADIRTDEEMIGTADYRCEVVKIARIGELVDCDDTLAVADESADEGRPYEAGTASHERRHEPYSKRSGCWAKRGNVRSRSETIAFSTVTGQVIMSSGSFQAMPRS